MGLLSFLKRQSDAPAEAVAPPDAVAVARTRARRRLIGATVLLVVGIVGFPLLFETQPRPVPVNIPIEIPRKDGAPAPRWVANSRIGTASYLATFSASTFLLSKVSRSTFPVCFSRITQLAVFMSINGG